MGVIPEEPFRQSRLVQSSGPGSVVVLAGSGLQVLISGVDSWYRDRNSGRQIVPDDAMVRDRYMAETLNVRSLVSPPSKDYVDGAEGNYWVGEVPVALFPRWMVCHSCKSLVYVKETNLRRPDCPTCKENAPRRRAKLYQVNFVVACQEGHMYEFPWIEWAHKGQPCLTPKLRFRSSGSIELKSQRVECSSCGSYRTLDQTNKENDDRSTVLSSTLRSNGDYLCEGKSPWLGDFISGCQSQVRLTLTNSSNAYFASTRTTIFVPDKIVSEPEIVEKFSRIEAKLLGRINRQGKSLRLQAIAEWLIDEYPTIFTESETRVERSLEEWLPTVTEDTALDNLGVPKKEREWQALTSPANSPSLTVVPNPAPTSLTDLGVRVINSVPALRETLVQVGFSRLTRQEVTLVKGRQLLSRSAWDPAWLPSVQNSGEGVFIGLDLNKIREWESRESVVARAQMVRNSLKRSKYAPQEPENLPRMLLLHSLAHLLISEFVLFAGYDAPSLKERLFFEGEQAGILIYTASSGGDGTMGGLVRLGRPDLFEDLLTKSLTKSGWCANDPICSEMASVGQGTNGLNLAACYSCLLLPETSCEHSNSYLDRGLLSGDLIGQQMGIAFFGE